MRVNLPVNLTEFDQEMIEECTINVVLETDTGVVTVSVAAPWGTVSDNVTNITAVDEKLCDLISDVWDLKPYEDDHDDDEVYEADPIPLTAFVRIAPPVAALTPYVRQAAPVVDVEVRQGLTPYVRQAPALAAPALTPYVRPAARPEPALTPYVRQAPVAPQPPALTPYVRAQAPVAPVPPAALVLRPYVRNEPVQAAPAAPALVPHVRPVVAPVVVPVPVGAADDNTVLRQILSVLTSMRETLAGLVR